MKKKLYIMVGIPASGKSTYLDRYRDKSIVISRDEIRYSFLEEGDKYFDKEKETYKEYIRQIQEALDDKNCNKDIYADATQIDSYSRGKLLRNLYLKNTDVYCIYIKVSLDKAKERNKKREGLARTPEKTIEDLYSILEVPSLEEFNYKTIITISNEFDK